MVPVSYLENCVYLQILVGVDRLACLGINGQVRWIDYLPWIASHLQNVFPRIRVVGSRDDTLTRVERAQVLVSSFGVSDLSARCGAEAVRGPWGEHRMVPSVVIVDAGGWRVTARHLPDKSRERVRGKGRARVGVVDAVSHQLCQRGLRVGLDVPSQIRLMHPVDRYKQYVFDIFLVVVVSRHCRERQQNARSGGT